jgi:hypothetical protein
MNGLWIGLLGGAVCYAFIALALFGWGLLAMRPTNVLWLKILVNDDGGVHVAINLVATAIIVSVLAVAGAAVGIGVELSRRRFPSQRAAKA